MGLQALASSGVIWCYDAEDETRPNGPFTRGDTIYILDEFRDHYFLVLFLLYVILVVYIYN